MLYVGMHAFRELDTVEVLVPLGGAEADDVRLPAGARAAIVDLGADHAFVEVVEKDGRVYGPYGVALSDLRLIADADEAGDGARSPSSAAHRAA